MKYIDIPTETLLRSLIGAEATEARYQGKLRPLFEGRVEGADFPPLLAVRELMRRWLAEEVKRGELAASPVEVKQYLQRAFARQSYESLVALYVDAQHRLIEAEEPLRGQLTPSAVDPREIVRRALHWNAAAVMYAHFLPIGAAEPSRTDELFTKSMKTTLALVDVRLLDYFVVAGSEVVSFAERGLL